MLECVGPRHSILHGLADYVPNTQTIELLCMNVRIYIPSPHCLVHCKLQQCHLFGHDPQHVLLRVLREAPTEVNVSAAGLFMSGVPRKVLNKIRLHNIGQHTLNAHFRILGVATLV